MEVRRLGVDYPKGRRKFMPTQVTKMAYSMVTIYGMNSELGLLSHLASSCSTHVQWSGPGPYRQLAQATHTVLGREVCRSVGNTYG